MHAAPAPKPSAPPGKEYVYKTSSGQPQTLEVYFPKGWDPATDKAPGMLLFHGGGWGGGNLQQFRVACRYFASRGLVAATANYRMWTKDEAKALPEGVSRKRVCVTDGKSAIRWMKSHAAELGVDPKRLIVGGGSAGGHIAVLSTLTPESDDPADPKQIDTSVVAYVLFNPAFSAGDSADPAVDVLQHLTANFAPAIAFFGTDDKWKTGWDAVQKKLRSLGNSATELWLAEGQGHSFFNKPPWQNLTLIEADRFLVQQKLLTGEPTLALPATGEKLTHSP